MVWNSIKSFVCCFACVALVSCYAETDVQATAEIASPKINTKVAEEIKTEFHGKIVVDKTRVVSSTVGAMTTEKGVNVGSISVEGSVAFSALLMGLLVAIVVLIKKFITSRKALDLLIKFMEPLANNGIKVSIEKEALKKGVESYLHSRVKRVTKPLIKAPWPDKKGCCKK